MYVEGLLQGSSYRAVKVLLCIVGLDTGKGGAEDGARFDFLLKGNLLSLK